MKGLVSVNGRPEDQIEVQILRDTGANQSFIISDIIPLSEQTSCGSSVLIQGIEMGVVKVPLHRVHLQCKLLTGFVNVGVRSLFPVKGVTFILGNDLAGGKVTPVVEVVDKPDCFIAADDIAEKHPDVFVANVVTRAQAQRIGKDIVLNDSFISPLFADENVLPESHVVKDKKSGNVLQDAELLTKPVSRTVMIAAQRSDPFLVKCFSAAEHPTSVKDHTAEYVLDDGLLLRKWRPIAGNRKAKSKDSTCPVSSDPCYWVSSPYHPESQGSIERFHQTLKSMLRKYCLESGKDWDEGVPLVLFGIRETVQESLGFSPADLVFGHTVRGPLKILKEGMLDEGASKKENILDYVSRFRERLHTACMFAKNSLAEAQKNMKKRFDRKSVTRLIKPGDEVLVLLPVPGSALSARFAGPYVVSKKLSDTDYVIHTPDRKRKFRTCHVNMLKLYCSRESPERVAEEMVGSEAGPSTSVAVISRATSENCELESPPSAGESSADDGISVRNAQMSPRLSNSEILRTLPTFLTNLTETQKQDIVNLINEFLMLFGDTPTQTNVLQHDIKITCDFPIKQHAYRVNNTKRSIMKTEVEYLLENGLAEPSFSPWSSPCLLVPKPDGTFRFCTDYRKVNSVTVPDSYPMPRMEDCIDSLGSAKFVTKLDLLKGYWQVPLTSRAAEISAFVTPDDFLQYKVMAFGLRNAPATFQRLVNTVLSGIPNCNAYLDDLVIYSSDWQEHLTLLKIVFTRSHWSTRLSTRFTLSNQLTSPGLKHRTVPRTSAYADR
ncbi:hypothetical protein QQF64_001378 [Cirrhinus molitorella]|uniref:ribonuclease H n=1 Tax=Cirrhinus molitorella TaxID=172907 RepID=A0ABR3P0A5_9TELE